MSTLIKRGLATTVSLISLSAAAAAETGAADASTLFLSEAPLTEEELIEARGGFEVGGFQFNFSFSITPVEAAPQSGMFGDGGLFGHDGVFGAGGVFGEQQQSAGDNASSPETTVAAAPSPSPASTPAGAASGAVSPVTAPSPAAPSPTPPASPTLPAQSAPAATPVSQDAVQPTLVAQASTPTAVSTPENVVLPAVSNTAPPLEAAAGSGVASATQQTTVTDTTPLSGGAASNVGETILTSTSMPAGETSTSTGIVNSGMTAGASQNQADFSAASSGSQKEAGDNVSQSTPAGPQPRQPQPDQNYSAKVMLEQQFAAAAAQAAANANNGTVVINNMMDRMVYSQTFNLNVEIPNFTQQIDLAIARAATRAISGNRAMVGSIF